MLIFDRYLLMYFLCDRDAAIHNDPFSKPIVFKGPSRDTALSFRKSTAHEWLESPKISIELRYGLTVQVFQPLMRLPFAGAALRRGLVRSLYHGVKPLLHVIHNPDKSKIF